jgi:hypothetical protein
MDLNWVLIVRGLEPLEKLVDFLLATLEAVPLTGVGA